MTRYTRYLSLFAVSLPLLVTLALPPAHAEAQPPQATLGHAFHQQIAYPKRGMGMQQVRQRFGKPHAVRVSAGKVRKHWPRITVWNYAGFSVYFERKRVLHTVVK